MSDSPQPGQPPTVDPQTGEDLSWKQTPVAIVLLDRPAAGHGEIGELLAEIFEGSFEVERGSDDDPATAVHVEDATVLVSAIDAPLPQATEFTRDLVAWNGGEAVVETHRSQVVVAAFRWGPLGDDGEPTEAGYLDPRLDTLRCELAVANVTAALTALPGELGEQLLAQAGAAVAWLHEEVLEVHAVLAGPCGEGEEPQ